MDSPKRQWHSLVHGAANHRWVHRLEAYSSAIAFERVAIQHGFRAATGIASVIALAVWLHRPQLAPAAFGAFWACLADPGGSYRSRFALMGIFAGAGTVTAFVASVTAGVGPLAAATALVPLVFLASLSAIYGAEASRVGTLVCVVAAVAVATPRSPEAALQSAGFFLCGCVWAMILCIGIWRIQRFAPARRAIAAAFGLLEAMAADLLALESSSHSPAASDWDAFNAEHRRRLRASIEQARGVVAVLETSDLRYRADIEAADQVFAALIAIGHGLAERALRPDTGRERDLIGRLRLLLAEAQRQVARRKPEPSLLFSQAAVLQDDSRALPCLTGRAIAVAAMGLSHLCESWRSAPGFRGLAAEPASARILRPIPTTALIHATRVAIAMVIAYAIGSSLNLR
ncbi:MAG: hypothetical protein JOZ12_03165, partial [Sinobacteraceae bacterium]|nr:hypothetical protein [Nevskiaceae bacterium]